MGSPDALAIATHGEPDFELPPLPIDVACRSFLEAWKRFDNAAECRNHIENANRVVVAGIYRMDHDAWNAVSDAADAVERSLAALTGATESAA